MNGVGYPSVIVGIAAQLRTKPSRRGKADWQKNLGSPVISVHLRQGHDCDRQALSLLPSLYWTETVLPLQQNSACRFHLVVSVFVWPHNVMCPLQTFSCLFPELSITLGLRLFPLADLYRLRPNSEYGQLFVRDRRSFVVRGAHGLAQSKTDLRLASSRGVIESASSRTHKRRPRMPH